MELKRRGEEVILKSASVPWRPEHSRPGAEQSSWRSSSCYCARMSHNELVLRPAPTFINADWHGNWRSGSQAAHAKQAKPQRLPVMFVRNVAVAVEGRQQLFRGWLRGVT